jgi:DNA repair protein RadC
MLNPYLEKDLEYNNLFDMDNNTPPNSIKQWAEDDRPREKMLLKGNQALSDAELLAILIQSGTRERSAVDLARDVLLLGKGNLGMLGRLSIKELQSIKGIGEARAISIAAALELGRRRQISEGITLPQIQDSKSAATILIPLLTDLNTEHFYVLYLNNSNKLIQYKAISNGGLASTLVDIRILFKAALQLESTQIIIAHNHPSGNLNPSSADKQLTHKIKEAGLLLDIKLLDHLIISHNLFFSFADEGLL